MQGLVSMIQGGAKAGRDPAVHYMLEFPLIRPGVIPSVGRLRTPAHNLLILRLLIAVFALAASSLFFRTRIGPLRFGFFHGPRTGPGSLAVHTRRLNPPPG